jgi:AcrR family transcriptional regulator
VTAATGARRERKQQTRQALLDAALRLLETRGFDGLSLREVARGAGIVPTAFYRHFADLTELGLALVEESFATLRAMIREARRAPAAPTAGGIIDASVRILVEHVHRNRAHFHFVVRERYSGVPELRQAIRHEIGLFVRELATDLARFPHLRDWAAEDLRMLAELLVNAMVHTAQEVLQTPKDRPDLEREIVRTARDQLLLVMVGVPNWRSR